MLLERAAAGREGDCDRHSWPCAQQCAGHLTVAAFFVHRCSSEQLLNFTSLPPLRINRVHSILIGRLSVATQLSDQYSKGKERIRRLTLNLPPPQFAEFAFRRCSTEGQWEGNPTANGSNTIVGWTNYTMCLSPEMAELMHKLHNQGEVRNSSECTSGQFTDYDRATTPSLFRLQMKIEIAERTRILEIVGLSVSLLTLLVSLAIFGHFR